MAGHDDHGNTPAAWTGVIIMIAASIVGGYFMVAGQPFVGLGAWVGLSAVGVAAGLVMRAMGLGKKPETLPAQRTAPAAERTAEPAPAPAAAAGN
ncbi:hypothetical protein N0X72_06055 [Streptomyces carpaticus]|uniref:Uncharacterized protein n=2 Tax=Streptomyces TaxID=1883 RepID=A0A1I6RWF7_9ACTN|nr:MULTISPECIES: HGxxPAAW family protein [Streptomyces]MCK1814573.1 hypothetical protein [Streptomyces sp. XM4011]QKV68284.1 hypothetical protein HUT13_05460 [Streptomyces harbinensis]UWM48621.1 hypothetical protein N0X72_06055 [Streptomyces carpaticus]SFS69023.1 hypothetical protein SAMN05444716_103543 [Streptomyces harbinensis]